MKMIKGQAKVKGNRGEVNLFAVVGIVYLVVMLIVLLVIF